MTNEEAAKFTRKLIIDYKLIEYKQKEKQKELMHLKFLPSKQIHKNIFYILVFTFIYAVIPSLYIQITFTNVVATFFISFFMTINFYDGFVDKRTILAWTEGKLDA